jgi:hypothetical protein
MTCSHAGIDSGAAADQCNGNWAAAGHVGAFTVKRCQGRLALPGQALLACSSACSAGAGPDRAEEDYLIGFKYCKDWRADLASGGGSGASWWTGSCRTGKLIDLPPESYSISSGMHMSKWFDVLHCART